MSCEYYYGRKKTILEVGLKQQKQKPTTAAEYLLDDRALLAYLKSQEKIAEKARVVSLDSMISG